MHLRDYAHDHVTEVLVFGFCLWLSLSLIIRLWLKQRRDSWFKKLMWSAILCIPLAGWLLYGAFYTPLSENSVRASLNRDAFNAGH